MSETLTASEPAFLSPTPTPTPARWSLPTRIAFRLGFCYLMLYALGCGNATLWEVIPFGAGDHLESWTAWPIRMASQWLSLHVFHFTGVGATLHDSGSGDRLLDWLAMAIMLALALLASTLWTLLAELRKQPTPAYPRLFFWFRLILRLTLGFAMLSYGSVKLFPLQMAPPSLAVLNEPLGNTSPMTMLWTLIGLNPVYQMICGAAEMAAGILILFRRTALLGTLLTAFLTTNIVLYNFCFDVPVKIYAAHLLLMSLALLLPWTPALFNFFYLHKPCAPTGGWTSPARRYGLRIETLATAIVLIATLTMASLDLGKGYAQQRANVRANKPLTGIWHIDAATLNGAPKPYLTPDGLPATDIILEPIGRTMLRDSSGVLWRAHASIDEKKHTFELGTEVSEPITYALAQPDPNHLILTPTPTDKAAPKNEAQRPGTLTLTRIPTPTHYPLLDRGFHFINEWGLER